MAIVPLDKLTLYGAESQQEAVIEQLQELGCVHVVNLSADVEDYPAHDVSSDAREALKYLRDCPEQLRQVAREDRFDRQQVVDDALRLRRVERELGDERDTLRKAVNDMKPWGEFKLPPDGRISDVRFWFYVVPLRDADKTKAIDLLTREIARDHAHAYVLVLSPNEPEDFPGTRAELDCRSLSELQRRLEEVEEELEECRHQRVGLSRWRDLLSGSLDKADDLAAKQRAVRQTLSHNRVYALQGWIPRDATESIRNFAKEHNLAASIEPPAPDEEPPTLLQHDERVAGAEALVTFYKIPDYRSWDPSLVAYISFAIFFAMILADAGYGVLLALWTAYYWKKMGETQGGRRGRNVLATVVGFTIVYGILCGSYFGVSPPADSPLGRLRILDAQSQSVMMPLTIVIGVIHLALANLVTAWLRRGNASALAPLGWVTVMIGATLAGIGAFAKVSEGAAAQFTEIGTILLVGGLVAVFLFSSQRPLFSLSVKNHVLRVLDGLKGLTGASSLFGDVLSYLRLFALGLSSAKLAETFNGLAAGAWDQAGFGVILAIGIVILGHTLNLLLSIMSGVVHGLRLNCIEFFNWSLPEEGYLFNAFTKKARRQ